MIVQLCERRPKRSHARATQWVRIEWQGYKGYRMSQTYAYCDSCTEDDKRVVEKLGEVIVTKRGEA